MQPAMEAITRTLAAATSDDNNKKPVPVTSVPHTESFSAATAPSTSTRFTPLAFPLGGDPRQPRHPHPATALVPVRLRLRCSKALDRHLLRRAHRYSLRTLFHPVRHVRQIP